MAERVSKRFAGQVVESGCDIGVVSPAMVHLRCGGLGRPEVTASCSTRHYCVLRKYEEVNTRSTKKEGSATDGPGPRHGDPFIVSPSIQIGRMVQKAGRPSVPFRSDPSDHRTYPRPETSQTTTESRNCAQGIKVGCSRDRAARRQIDPRGGTSAEKASADPRSEGISGNPRRFTEVKDLAARSFR